VIDVWFPGQPPQSKPHQLLSDDERARLATIGSIVQFKKGEQIYSSGQPAKGIFNIVSGFVKIYRSTGNSAEYVSAFIYPEALFGLFEEGRYVNSARAITSVTAYLLALEDLPRLSKDADLEFHIIVRLCQELRQAQRHALLLTQKHAVAKLAMFLELQEHVQSANGTPLEVYLPMDRSDIAGYVGMSLAAVSRGFRSLEGRGVIKYRDRRHVKIINRTALRCSRAIPTGRDFCGL